MESFFIVFEVV